MVIPAEVRAQLVAHSRHEVPNEACGVIAGPEGSDPEAHGGIHVVGDQREVVDPPPANVVVTHAATLSTTARMTDGVTRSPIVSVSA